MMALGYGNGKADARHNLMSLYRFYGRKCPSRRPGVRAFVSRCPRDRQTRARLRVFWLPQVSGVRYA